MKVLNLSDVPIYDKAIVSLPKIVEVMGVTRKEFSEIANISISQIRNGEPSPQTRLKIREIVNIISLLWKLSNKNKEIVRQWLHSPDDQYWGLSPIQFMAMDRSNISTVFKNLQEVEYGEVMGR